jgi:hypothetical protein
VASPNQVGYRAVHFSREGAKTQRKAYLQLYEDKISSAEVRCLPVLSCMQAANPNEIPCLASGSKLPLAFFLRAFAPLREADFRT